MTETEPEFDRIERDTWVALAEYEDALCPQCGNLRSVCENPDVGWYPQRHVCNATISQEIASRKWHKKHEKAEPNSIGALPTDGTLVWVSEEDLTPDDNFL